ncbi:GH25 family lysozyme [Butyribacter sp.]|uniref:GH25 family lysozyme n=1 Tax=Butyribacter sp. TaxID=2822465 RepID=UPI002A93E784|nr:GH25 family lysozyme [Butyribacter sp.]
MKKKFLSRLLICSLIIQSVFLFSDTTYFLNNTHVSAAITGKSPFTSSTYTHNDIFKNYNIYNGIDVSKYNGDINWDKAKKDGVDFVIVRVGYRGYGKSGTLCTDPNYKANIEGALAAGIKVGVYYFTEALTTDEAREEAEFCISKIKDYNITLPVAIDYEYPTDGKNPIGRMYNAKLTKAEATANVKAFCAAVKKAGYTPLVYANKSDLSSLINGKTIGNTYKVWLANYTTKTTYANSYEYWQYTSSGKVNGITGKVDCNFWYTKKSIDTAETTSSPVITPTNTPKPTAAPTVKPTAKPTAKPTVKPTVKPTAKPTATPAQTTKISAPKPFKAVSTSKSITLKWTAPKNATGFEIYRKDFYDGKYKKVKTINNVKTQKYVDSNVESYHEYYYKIRSVNSKSAKKLYSSYLSLTVSAMQHKAAITTSSLKLLKKPSAQADTLKTLPKKFILEYTGKTTYKNNTTFLHMYYYTKNKKYNCWLPADSKLKYYKGGTAKTSTKLLKEAKSITNAIVNVPSGSYMAVLSTKKIGLLSFYKVRYSDSSKSYVGYVTAKHIVLQ